MTRLHFDSDKAWKFLTEHRYVLTIRPSPRREPPALQEVEIWREGKRTEFLGRKVTLYSFSSLAQPFREYLEDHVKHSGFKSAEEWGKEAERLSGEPEEWTLYYVEVRPR